VRSEQALAPLQMYPDVISGGTQNAQYVFELLKDYLSLFGLTGPQIYPLYMTTAAHDPLEAYEFIALESFLVILFTKVPANLANLEADLRQKSVDFIRKSLNVMISFLQVKSPPTSQNGGLPVPLANECVQTLFNRPTPSSSSATNPSSSNNLSQPSANLLSRAPPPLQRMCGAASTNGPRAGGLDSGPHDVGVLENGGLAEADVHSRLQQQAVGVLGLGLLRGLEVRLHEDRHTATQQQLEQEDEDDD